MIDDLSNRSANRNIPSTWMLSKPKSPSALQPTPTLRDEAAAYVRSKTGQAGPASIDARLTAIRKAATTVTKASRAQHHEAVALAYALYLANHEEPEFKELVAGLAADARLRVTKATDPLAIIVGSLITYGGGSDAAATRKLRSRDVHAIRYLMRKRVAPDGVSAEAARKGEGLNAWARRTASAERKPKIPTNISGRAEKRFLCRWRDQDYGPVTLQTSRPLNPAAQDLFRQAFRVVCGATQFCRNRG